MDIQNLIGTVPIEKYTPEQRRITILSLVAQNFRIRLKDYNVNGTPTGHSRKLWGKGRGILGNKNYMPDRVKEQLELNEQFEADEDIIANEIIEKSLVIMEDLLMAARNAKTRRVKNNYINALNNREFMLSTLELSIYLYAKEIIEQGHSIKHEYFTLKIKGAEANKTKLTGIWKRYANEEISLDTAIELTDEIFKIYQNSLQLTQNQLDTIGDEILLLKLADKKQLEQYMYGLADGVASSLTGKIRLFLPEMY